MFQYHRADNCWRVEVGFWPPQKDEGEIKKSADFKAHFVTIKFPLGFAWKHYCATMNTANRASISQFMRASKINSYDLQWEQETSTIFESTLWTEGAISCRFFALVWNLFEASAKI